MEYQTGQDRGERPIWTGKSIRISKTNEIHTLQQAGWVVDLQSTGVQEEVRLKHMWYHVLHWVKESLAKDTKRHSKQGYIEENTTKRE